MALASRGLRNINDKEEKIENEEELKQIHRQARRVTIKGTLVAIPLTLLTLLIP